MIPSTATYLTKKEGWDIQKRWLRAFAARVKRDTGKSILGEFMWHGFSHDVQPHLSGAKAWQAYSDKEIEPYYLFGENVKPCLFVDDAGNPTSFPEGEDWYVTPISWQWTYVSTHEEWEFFAMATDHV